MDLTELQGMLNALEIILYPSPDLYFLVTFSVICFECYSNYCEETSTSYHQLAVELGQSL